jgi:hypothetical protein
MSLWFSVPVCALCLVVVVCTSLAGIRRFLRGRHLARAGVPASGTVVSKRRRLSFFSLDDLSFHTTVRFEDERGEPVESESEVSWLFFRSLTIGDSVRVRYRRTDREEFVFPNDRWVVTCFAEHILIAVIGTAVVLLCVGRLLARPPH